MSHPARTGRSAELCGEIVLGNLWPSLRIFVCCRGRGRRHASASPLHCLLRRPWQWLTGTGARTEACWFSSSGGVEVRSGGYACPSGTKGPGMAACGQRDWATDVKVKAQSSSSRSCGVGGSLNSHAACSKMFSQSEPACLGTQQKTSPEFRLPKFLSPGD